MKDLTLDKDFCEAVLNLIMSCYPGDMENFDTMTDSQAYRLLNNLWDKLTKQ